MYLSDKPLVVERARARERFERAIELAPEFAPAHAAWARLMITLHQPPLEVLPPVEAAVERALELDPDLAEAHVVRGKVRMLLHHDWTTAEASFRRALELDPSSVDGHLGYANLLAALGRHSEALRRVHRARELEPASALVSADLGWYYYSARRLSFARDQIAAEIASGRANLPGIEIGTLEDYWRARLRIYDGWRRLGFYVSPAVDAGLYLALGDPERALELLDQACRERSLPLLLGVDRRFDPLRADERFVRLSACAGLG